MRAPMTPPTPASAGPFVSTRRALSRRSFLRGSGILMGLPLLETMSQVFGASSGAGADAKPRRMLAVCNNLGLLSDQFFPAEGGREYALSPYLQGLAEHRKDFTVFSGVSHP